MAITRSAIAPFPVLAGILAFVAGGNSGGAGNRRGGVRSPTDRFQIHHWQCENTTTALKACQLVFK
ncbi:hypothetical protein [Lyngbya sp. CCY1209]|uniref:hypothetical protein n=1 Tax=Lyngbya sp. CCY1209 TaxID=2886103 RepID=UPI002D2002B2|nr:hypothetical protein [Lyngbya sp. CCY1209]MEB3885383.1 hypothetical protein [Lyngbya sp. CCY1209]